MTHQEFTNNYLGKRTDYDGGFGYQCVDLNKLYADKVDGTQLRQFGGGAKRAWNLYPDSAYSADKWVRVANNPKDPNQTPPTGAHAIFEGAWGNPYGHIGIVHSAPKSVNWFLLLEQNGGMGSGKGFGSDRIRLRYVKYSANGAGFGKLLGWYTRK